MTEKTPVEALKDAREIVSERWVKGSFAAIWQDDPDNICHCALGALAAANGATFTVEENYGELYARFSDETLKGIRQHPDGTTGWIVNLPGGEFLLAASSQPWDNLLRSQYVNYYISSEADGEPLDYPSVEDYVTTIKKDAGGSVVWEVNDHQDATQELVVSIFDEAIRAAEEAESLQS